MKALIVTPILQVPIRSLVHPDTFDVILCADSAYQKAEKENLSPFAVLGDFDHGDMQNIPENAIRFPREKDDTDTMLCVKYAIEKGAEKIVILGGIGGRLDHTYANLQTLAYCKTHGVKAVLMGDSDTAFLLGGTVKIPKDDGFYLSVFAYGGNADGVTLQGVKYPAQNIRLTEDFPLGVSNEITEKEATISVQSGTLLIIQSKKD